LSSDGSASNCSAAPRSGRDVRAHALEPRLRLFGAQLLHNGIDADLVVSVDRRHGATLGQASGDRPPDALGRAADERALSGKSERHRTTF
jgi:hypothetical protein